jgi:type III restriction enzyme
VREYLIDKLGAHPEQIKVKSSEMDELSDQDLLSDLCPVRYIITKDALREGWDCPFAYVLAVLSKTTANTALTQMIGRVLRQPEARSTSIESLNQCYVFTYDQEVQTAVLAVRNGLEQEGMGDLGSSVRAKAGSGSIGSRRETLTRRDKFKNLKIFLPRVLSRHYKTREWRQFDYERDLLPRIVWAGLSFTQRDDYTADEKGHVERTLVRLSTEDLLDDADPAATIVTSDDSFDPEIDFPALVRPLLDVVPNPWQCARILRESLDALRRKGTSERRIYTNRLFLLKAIKDDLARQVSVDSEKIFRKDAEGRRTVVSDRSLRGPDLNWELAETLEVNVSDEDAKLPRRDGTPLQRSLFEPVYRGHFNVLERNVALYVDENDAVAWWHRIAVHQDWYLQGWQRRKVYPDFLVCLVDRGDGIMHLSVLETKGKHLLGSEDTEYKRKLMDLLTKHSQSSRAVGELKLETKQQKLRFELLLEEDWQQKLVSSI